MRAFVLAAVAGALLVAGCGADDKPYSDSSKVESVEASGFSTIEPGDSESDVRTAMGGKPTVVTDFGTGPYYWEYCSETTYWKIDFEPEGVTGTETGEMSAVRCIE
jgi:outer membrane protein assembly factor BamE (lipoprotein component of BamABCDE complex)